MCTKTSEVYTLLDEITELAALSNLGTDGNPLEKLTEIFMRSVKATAILDFKVVPERYERVFRRSAEDLSGGHVELAQAQIQAVVNHLASLPIVTCDRCWEDVRQDRATMRKFGWVCDQCDDQSDRN